MISVTDRAREYLMRKGGEIHIVNSRNTSLCCGRINFGPTVRMGRPVNMKDYTETVINGIRVYLPRQFESPSPLTVDITKFFGLTTLHLDGWKLL